MSRQKGISVPSVGGSSLLVIFAVLCLTVFSLLSLSTVLAEKRLGDASRQTVSAYYDADSQAELIFAELRSGTVPENVSEDDGIYSYTCYISENQQLHVELKHGDSGWTVLRWQAVPISEHSDTDLPVWDGETVSQEVSR